MPHSTSIIQQLVQKSIGFRTTRSDRALDIPNAAEYLVNVDGNQVRCSDAKEGRIAATDAICVTDDMVVVVEDGRLLVRRSGSTVEVLPRRIRAAK